jgi:hypothetical protein
MEREPKESDSIRDGSEAIASSTASEEEDASGRMEERTPGENVAGAKTCFMILRAKTCFMILYLDIAMEEREPLIKVVLRRPKRELSSLYGKLWSSKSSNPVK